MYFKIVKVTESFDYVSESGRSKKHEVYLIRCLIMVSKSCKAIILLAPFNFVLKVILSVCHAGMWGVVLSFDRFCRNGMFIIPVDGNFENHYNCLH